jgi:hypothetical protein
MTDLRVKETRIRHRWHDSRGWLLHEIIAEPDQEVKYKPSYPDAIHTTVAEHVLRDEHDQQVTLEEFGDWLAEHGVDMNEVKEMTFVGDSLHLREGRVYLKVTRYMRNHKGEHFFDRSTEPPGAAIETVWVPLRHVDFHVPDA